ncbi:Uu.00g069650.m01.CDS01 [Anthostomella pinea]|uniref:Chromatin modification-related protein EAF3 n=1 Tax=Anthostomella pinea TaxID=933095 RepID=A0AAI8VVE1_9PEZI|nr:Uu.00g069650.m01.CDS01 [Anthostomella pinea]
MAPSKQEKAPPYSKDEKVLCFHGDLMYEAKVTEVKVEAGKKAEDAQYRIHYKGWKASWDDWVSHDRIRKFTDDNKQLATQLQAQARMRTQGPKGGKKSGVKPNGSEMSSARGSEERAAGSLSFAGRGPRRGRDYELENSSTSNLQALIPDLSDSMSDKPASPEAMSAMDSSPETTSVMDSSPPVELRRSQRERKRVISLADFEMPQKRTRSNTTKHLEAFAFSHLSPHRPVKKPDAVSFPNLAADGPVKKFEGVAFPNLAPGGASLAQAESSRSSPTAPTSHGTSFQASPAATHARTLLPPLRPARTPLPPLSFARMKLPTLDTASSKPAPKETALKKPSQKKSSHKSSHQTLLHQTSSHKKSHHKKSASTQAPLNEPTGRKKTAKHTRFQQGTELLSAETVAFRQKEAECNRAQTCKDHLIALPPSGLVYVDNKQRLVFDEKRFQPEKVISVPKQHPKAKAAARLGLLHAALERYYEGMPANVTIPIAGIPSLKPYAPLYAAAMPFIWRAVRAALTDEITDFSPPDEIIHFSLPDEITDSSLPDEITDFPLQEEAFHARPSVKLLIPDMLKALMVDDWENITKNMQLVPLPRPKPVNKILEDYLAYERPRRQDGSSHVAILDETLAGLKEYFDKALGRILLYRFERAQYAEMHKKWNSADPEFSGKTASDTYGAEHLTRLMTSLPELIAQTNMDQQSVNRLQEELLKFCGWLSRNHTDYFLSNYESPNSDYAEKIKN